MMDCNIDELLEVLVSDVEAVRDALHQYCRASVALILGSFGGQVSGKLTGKKNFKKSVYKLRK